MLALIQSSQFYRSNSAKSLKRVTKAPTRNLSLSLSSTSEKDPSFYSETENIPFADLTLYGLRTSQNDTVSAILMVQEDSSANS